METCVYNSNTAKIVQDLDLFLLPLLHSEHIPPKLIFFISPSRELSEIILKGLFSNKYPSKIQGFSGLTLTKLSINMSSVLLIEAIGEWDYASEVLGLALCNSIIVVLDYESIEDFEIEKIYDIIIRLDTQDIYKNNNLARNFVLYVVNSNENLNEEMLEHKIIEGFRRKWEVFPKVDAWKFVRLEDLLRIEIKRVDLKQNKPYIPLGFFTRAHEKDWNIGELYSVEGVSQEVLRLLKENQEYLYLDGLKSRCFNLQCSNIHKLLFTDFQKEIIEIKKNNNIKINFKSLSNEIINKYMTKFEMRTQGLSQTKGSHEVLDFKQKFKEEIIKELYSLSQNQKTLILHSAESFFANNLSKSIKKFKETKQISFLNEAKIVSLEQIETWLQNSNIDFHNEKIDSSQSINELIPLENLIKQFESRITSIVEKERKLLLKSISDSLSQEFLKIIETTFSGDDLLLGRDFWDRLKRKLSQTEEKYFIQARREFKALDLQESLITSDLERISNNQKYFVELEFEKRKYKLEEYFIRVFQINLKKRVRENLQNYQKIGFKKLNETQRDMLHRDLKFFCQGMLEKMEDSLKSMRHMTISEGKIWLHAEDLNLIIQAMTQTLENDIKKLPEIIKQIEKSLLLKRALIFTGFIVLFLLTLYFVRWFKVKMALAVISLLLGIYFSEFFPLKKKKLLIK